MIWVRNIIKFKSGVLIIPIIFFSLKTSKHSEINVNIIKMKTEFNYVLYIVQSDIVILKYLTFQHF